MQSVEKPQGPPTDFELVRQFHQVFGHPCPDTLQKSIITENPCLTNFRLDLIEEEFNELKDAVRNNDMNGVIDALFDLKYVVNGMAIVFGIDLDEAFRIGHESNMSKLCRSESEAEETIQHYKTLPEFENVEVSYRRSSDGKYFVIYNAHTDKILKSKNWHPPDFSSLLK